MENNVDLPGSCLDSPESMTQKVEGEHLIQKRIKLFAT